MSDNRRVYRAMKSAIRQLYPTEPTGSAARHLHTLAAIISGIVCSKHTNLPAIAGKVSDGAKPESRVKKYYRWLTNDSIDVKVYFLLFVDALLESLAHLLLVLAMDGSEAGRGCLVLMVSLIYKKRALSLAWVVVKGCKGHFPEEAHVELVNQVPALIPEGSIVFFLGDGEFDGTELQALLVSGHAVHTRRMGVYHSPYRPL